MFIFVLMYIKFIYMCIQIYPKALIMRTLALQPPWINAQSGRESINKSSTIKIPVEIIIQTNRKIFYNKSTSTSQIQTIIRLTEKKVKDNRFIKNWQPVSLLNVLKVLPSRSRKDQANFVKENETAYVKNCFVIN